MHAPDNSTEGTVSGKFTDIIQGVDYSRVGASQQYPCALFGLQKKGLVVRERVGAPTGLILIKRPAGILEAVRPGDGTCHTEPGKDLRRSLRPDGIFQHPDFLRHPAGHANLPD